MVDNFSARLLLTWRTIRKDTGFSLTRQKLNWVFVDLRAKDKNLQIELTVSVIRACSKSQQSTLKISSEHAQNLVRARSKSRQSTLKISPEHA